MSITSIDVGSAEIDRPQQGDGVPDLVEHLELATVIKVSQALSGEMVLEKLIDILMRTAIEHAGADRGLLILSQGTEQRIAAEATTGGDTIVDVSDGSVTSAALPESVLYYVMRTQETVLLADASAQSAFSADPYVVDRHPRSVLCLPLLNRGTLIGILYLENSLAPHVFAPGRVAVLKLIASQAAISLENTRLYRDLARREAKIRRLIDSNVVGIQIWDLDGHIVEANDAFLRLVGYERKDLLSGRLRWTDLTPSRWHDRDRQEVVAQVQQSGSVQPFEWEYFHKDGSRVPVLVAAAIFEGESQGIGFVLDLSESKRVENALRRSEAYLADTQRLTQTGSWAFDATGFTYWSLELFKIYGLSPDGKGPSIPEYMALVHPEDREFVAKELREMLVSRRRFDFTQRIVRPDGAIRHVRCVGAPAANGPGLIGTGIDITEWKRTEQALRQSEAYLEEAQRLSHTGSWAYNHATGKLTYFSEEAFRLFGLDPRRGYLPDLEEIRQVMHPEDRERMFRQLEQVFRDKAEYVQDYRVVMPDETVRHLHSIGHPVLDRTGALVEYLGTVIDVTERQNTENRLLAQHQVSLVLAEAATVEEAAPRILQAVCEYRGWDIGILWRLDREAGVLRCAELWRRPSLEAPLFEAATRARTFESGKGLPGRVWERRAPVLIRDVVDDPNFPRAAIAAREGLHAGCAFPILLGNEFLGVLEFLSRGAQRPEQAMVDLMVPLGSQIGQFIERKRAESALQLAQANLAHVNRVLTMGELTASIAHEVNQPLGAMVTSAASSVRWLAAKPPQMEKARRSLERIVKDGRRAGAIIQRIRALMKRQAPRKDWLDVNDMILEVIALAQYELRRNAVVLATGLAEGLPRVAGDRVQLQQVLLNLMVNAIEAMSGIRRRRELVIVSATEGPHAVRIEVRDTGTGLDSAGAARVFEPFYTTKADGVGIGLSISRSIVEAHGGELSASANVPYGAVFQFSLPVEAEMP